MNLKQAHYVKCIAECGSVTAAAKKLYVSQPSLSQMLRHLEKELGVDLFDRSSSALVIEPAYPAYVDANVMAGRKIVHLASGEENGFLPEPSEEIKADLLYICSPNNPTGAVFSRNQLQAWVDFANENDSIILFDALPVGARRAILSCNFSYESLLH